MQRNAMLPGAPIMHAPPPEQAENVFDYLPNILPDWVPDRQTINNAMNPLMVGANRRAAGHDVGAGQYHTLNLPGYLMGLATNAPYMARDAADWLTKTMPASARALNDPESSDAIRKQAIGRLFEGASVAPMAGAAFRVKPTRSQQASMPHPVAPEGRHQFRHNASQYRPDGLTAEQRQQGGFDAYYGSQSKIDAYDPSRGRTLDAVWTTPDENYAKFYAGGDGGHVSKLRVNPGNYLDYDSAVGQEALKRAYDAEGLPVPSYDGGKTVTPNYMYVESNPAVVNRLRADGYDGMWMGETNAFDSLASWNRGTLTKKGDWRNLWRDAEFYSNLPNALTGAVSVNAMLRNREE